MDEAAVIYGAGGKPALAYRLTARRHEEVRMVRFEADCPPWSGHLSVIPGSLTVEVEQTYAVAGVIRRAAVRLGIREVVVDRAVELRATRRVQGEAHAGATHGTERACG
jgi:hypothetical protein